MGQVDEALPLAQELVRLYTTKLGENHADTLWAHLRLAGVHANAGRADEARAILRRTLEQSRSQLGDTHPQTLALVTACLALMENAPLSDPSPLNAHFEETVRLQRLLWHGHTQLSGPSHQDTRAAAWELTESLILVGRLDEARALLESLIDTTLELSGEDAADLRPMRNRLGVIYRSLGLVREAVILHRGLYEGLQDTDPDNPERVDVEEALGLSLSALGEYSEAFELQRHVWQVRAREIARIRCR